MPSLRTALVLTLSAAAATLAPAGSAFAASSLPGPGVADALPTSAVTDALPTSAVTDALPTSAVTDALPTSAVTDALPTSAVTDALPTSVLADALPTQSVADALASGIAPVKNLKLDPLSGSGTDPLDNAVGSQIADFKPLSTAAATGPIAHGGSLSTLPIVGTAVGLLPG